MLHPKITDKARALLIRAVRTAANGGAVVSHDSGANEMRQAIAAAEEAELELQKHIAELESGFHATRRDYFAAAALTGTLGSHYESTLPEAAARYAEIAVRLADATIAELDK